MGKNGQKKPEWNVKGGRQKEVMETKEQGREKKGIGSA
jgi:hypothetical protein